MAKTFWTKTSNGNIAHVNGCKDSIQAIHAVIDAAAVKHLNSASDWVIEGKADPSGAWVVLMKIPSENLARQAYRKLLEDRDGEYRLVRS